VIERIPKLAGIYVTDKDGVTLLKSIQSNSSNENSVDAQNIFDPALVQVFSSCADQASKLTLGNNNSITTIHENYILIQVNDSPIAINLIAATDANIGLLNAAIPELKVKLEGIRSGLALAVQTQSDH
jgi:hypothetical protein